MEDLLTGYLSRETGHGRRADQRLHRGPREGGARAARPRRHRARARRGRARPARGDPRRARPLLGPAAPAPRAARGRPRTPRAPARATPTPSSTTCSDRRARRVRRPRRVGPGRRARPGRRASSAAGSSWSGIQDHPYNRRHLDTFSLLAFLAARTERVRLFPDVANLPLRHPAMLAKAAATIDVLSGGRFELGLGAGAFWDGDRRVRRAAPERPGVGRRARGGDRDPARLLGRRALRDLRGRALPRPRPEVRPAPGAPDRHLARRLRPAHDARRRPARRRLAAQPAAAAAGRAAGARPDDRRRRPSAPAATRARSAGSPTSTA